MTLLAFDGAPIDSKSGHDSGRVGPWCAIITLLDRFHKANACAKIAARIDALDPHSGPSP